MEKMNCLEIIILSIVSLIINNEQCIAMSHLEYPGEALPAPSHQLPPPAVEDIAAQAHTRQHQTQQPGYHGEAGVDIQIDIVVDN